MEFTIPCANFKKARDLNAKWGDYYTIAIMVDIFLIKKYQYMLQTILLCVWHLQRTCCLDAHLRGPPGHCSSSGPCMWRTRRSLLEKKKSTEGGTCTDQGGCSTEHSTEFSLDRATYLILIEPCSVEQPRFCLTKSRLLDWANSVEHPISRTFFF